MCKAYYSSRLLHCFSLMTLSQKTRFFLRSCRYKQMIEYGILKSGKVRGNHESSKSINII